MSSKLLKSITSLAVIVAIGAGATYAAFVSNVVTISSSTLASGHADIKLCNASGANDWRETISPNLTASGLAPGGPEKELTEDIEIYIGNDSGTLDVNDIEACGSYASSRGDSSVAMKILPNVNEINCEEGINPEDFLLRFEIDAANSVSKTLTDWTTNNSEFLEPTFNPDDIGQVKVFAELAEDVEEQGASCTFDITFTGEQV